MLIASLFILAGLVLLMVAGDKLVEGAAGLAVHFKVSAVFVGIVIIGFGTSVPELLATGTAALKGATDLALGNVIGSNIANVALILAFSLLITKDMPNLPTHKKDYFLMLAVLVGFTALCFAFPTMGLEVGLFLLAALVGYILLSLYFGKSNSSPDAAVEEMSHHVGLSALFIVGGLAGLALGANLLVNGATTLALLLGVSEKVIGIALVAVGTSLPELAASIAAAKRNELGLTIGNILGSNVFNILGAAGLTATLAQMPTQNFYGDMFVMLAMVGVLIPVFIRPLPALVVKVFAFALLSGYVGYMVYLVNTGAV